MTREEALRRMECCRNFLANNYSDMGEPNITAFNMAIKALEQEPNGDLISREETLNAFADYVGSGMSMNDYDALWDIVAKIPSVNPQEPKFIAKSDGTIEQIKNCNDCLFKKEWEKIGKLISIVLEKQTEQESETGHCEDAISREDALMCMTGEFSPYVLYSPEDIISKRIQRIKALPSVQPKIKAGRWIGHFGTWECSRCAAEFSGDDFDFDYCPRCGAKMIESSKIQTARVPGDAD